MANAHSRPKMGVERVVIVSPRWLDDVLPVLDRVAALIPSVR